MTKPFSTERRLEARGGAAAGSACSMRRRKLVGAVKCSCAIGNGLLCSR